MKMTIRQILTLTFSLCVGLMVHAGHSTDEKGQSTSVSNNPNLTSEVNFRRNRNHFQKGIHLISIGYGFPTWGGQPFSDLKEEYIDGYSQSGYGPIFLKYDYAFSDHWSIGFTGRFTNTAVDYPVESGDSSTMYTQSRMSVAGMVRGNYHFGTTRLWDPYVGAGIGYGFNSFTLTAGDADNTAANFPASPSPIALEATIGARFFITPKFAAFAEVGYSQSLASLGVTIKL